MQSQEARAHEDDGQKAPIGLRSTDLESPKTELIPSAELLLSTSSSRRWKRTGLYLACGAVVLAGLGVGAYRKHSLSRHAPDLTLTSSRPEPSLPLPPVDPPPPAESAPVLDPVAAPAASLPAPSLEAQQRRLIDLAHAAADASDYKVAEDRLDEAARLDGPLNTTIADLRRQFSEQARSAQTQRAAQEERSRWDRAMKHMQSGELDDAEKLLREMIALPGAVHRRADAERYVDQIIPQRRQEELLWADLQQSSRSVSPDHFAIEVKTLDKLLILGSDRQQEARQLRGALIARLAQANATKSRKPLPAVSVSDRGLFAELQNRFDRAVRQGNVEALQQLHSLRPQFKALTRREGLLGMDARDYLSNLIPKAEKQIQANLAKADADAAANAEYETAGKTLRSGCRGKRSGCAAFRHPHRVSADRFRRWVASKRSSAICKRFDSSSAKGRFGRREILWALRVAARCRRPIATLTPTTLIYLSEKVVTCRPGEGTISKAKRSAGILLPG